MKSATAYRQRNPETPDELPVVLIRHAQSLWNKENRFTGWADPPLTEDGVTEAIQAGELLHKHNYHFDSAYSSRLQRAVTTLDIILQQTGQNDLPRQMDWRLNERHYGTLQGNDKGFTAAQAGEHQVWRWRRGYFDKANPLPGTDPRHPKNDPTYDDVDPLYLPGVENLAQTRMRVASFWQEKIFPRILLGQRVLISSHGNTLRALLMELGEMSVAEVEDFEIPTATPIVYTFSRSGQPLGWDYLRSEESPDKRTA